MSFVVHFEDETTAVVDDADSYEQEGPLTTFFDRNGGGRLSSSFAVRVASFRTNRIVDIRRAAVLSTVAVPIAAVPIAAVPIAAVPIAQSSTTSASSTTTSHRCAHSPHR